MLVRGGGGAIVNTATIAGLVDLQMAAHYVAGKNGVVGPMKTAAIKYSQDSIRVKCVSSGCEVLHDGFIAGGRRRILLCLEQSWISRNGAGRSESAYEPPRGCLR